jgi:hypothetical protein
VAQRKTTSNTRKRRILSKSTKKTSTRRRTKPGAAKRAAGAMRDSLANAEVTIDRRRGARRDENSQRVASASGGAPPLERRKKVNRRRQIDPTTCERDYTEQEVEFMNALDEYKRKSGRMFPTCSEVLEVLRSLGYVKLAPAELAARSATGPSATSAKPMPADWAPLSQSLEAAAGFVTPPIQQPQLSC